LRYGEGTKNESISDAGLRRVIECRKLIMSDKSENAGKRDLSRRNILLSGTTFAAAAAVGTAAPAQLAQAQQQPTIPTSGKKPNILVIFGDDIGQSDISAYTFGLMGYRTPNIDRIAKEGLMFTDYYAEQSCTAGRSSFITGQSVLRTGLSKVGIPGATVGLQPEDITIAEALKPLGYATGQFGKNHLGDRNEFLPTVHGFDEFFGNLYHLNAEEEPEDPDYPKDPAFRAKFGPRGVIKSKASDKDDPTGDPRVGKVGKQTIEDTGPLNKKRMETIDDETTAAAIDFMQRQVKANKPFFVWMNTTRMHLYTHVRASMRGQSGMPDNEYADGMIEHDGDVGKLLKIVDDLNITKDTFVVYTTDNGPHMNSWPDAAMTPFRSEKNTNWEGAFRVPAMVRWPGHIKPGSVANDIFGSHDWFPTLLAVAGDTGVKDRLLRGWQIGDRTYRVHIDGYDQLAYLTGTQEHSDRKGFIYFDDDGQLVAIRFGNWKLVFFEQKTLGTLDVWGEPFTPRRLPLYFNLRMDPYERAQITSNSYYAWTLHKVYLLYGAQTIAGEFIATLKDFPPRQKPQSFNLDQIMERLKEPTND
jgi:arylsulfatase A-like enzyme